MPITIIAAIIQGGFELLRTHLNKPQGWIPSQQDIEDLLTLAEEATPEHEKSLAKMRLGLP